MNTNSDDIDPNLGPGAAERGGSERDGSIRVGDPFRPPGRENAAASFRTVDKAQIIARGLANRCPNCGAKTLFPPRALRIRRRCPECGTGFDRGAGFFLGPLVLNYTVTVFVFVLPAIVAGIIGLISWKVAAVAAVLGCTVIPFLLYRNSWSWWLMMYFYLLPDFLPANGGPTGDQEED